MEVKCYLKDLAWGVILFCSVLYVFYLEADKASYEFYGGLLFFGLNALLFPFSKRGVESLVLRYTSRRFWTTGFFMESPAKNGAYALFYVLCFFFAIPFGVIYLVWFLLGKRYSKE